MKIPSYLAILAIVCLSDRAGAAAPEIPALAHLAGIKVGFDSMETLEKRVGEGFVTIGGHARGARTWDLPQPGWSLFADGFYYNDAGERIIDQISIDSDDRSPNCPLAKLSGDQMRFMGVVSLGMTRAKVLNSLDHLLPKPKMGADSLSWSAKGYFSFNKVNKYVVENWKAVLGFQKGILCRIYIEADVD